MNEMTIKIEIPGLADALAGLTQAATCLADAIDSRGSSTPVTGGSQVQVPPTGAPVPAAAPIASVPLAAGGSPAAPMATPAAAPDPAVPVAGAPAYTLDQISYAGASLVDAGKMEPLLALLARYGVQAVTQLPPEQYGAFATELRALGAQI